MHKATFVLLLVFAFAAFVSAVDSQIGLESGIVASARVFPIAAGESAEELANYSIASAFKALSLDRFLQYCGTTRLNPRLATPLSTLTTGQLCAGTDEFANICSTTNCESFLNLSTCDLTEEELEAQCVQRLENERQAIFADLQALEQSLANRCGDFQQSYQGGEVTIGPLDTTVARQACIAQGFQYHGVDGIGECTSTEVGAGENENAPLEVIEIGGAGGGEIAAGGEGASGSGGANGGGDGGVLSDEIGGEEMVIEGEATIDSVAYTCTDSDGPAKYTSRGTLTVNFNTTYSNGTNIQSTESTLDSCFNATHLQEYYCPATSGSITPPEALVFYNSIRCGANTTCSTGRCVSTASGPTSSTATYTCSDSDNGAKTTAAGTVTLAYSDGRIQTYTDACTNSTHVQEYYCSSGRSYSRNLTCPTGYSCPEGGRACLSTTPRPVTYTCSDSDGGISPTAGTVTITASNSTTASFNDFCVNATHAGEFYCINSTASFAVNKSFFCPEGCNSTSAECINSSAASSATAKVVAVDTSPESSGAITILPQEQVRETCIAQLRAKVFESYAMETIRSTCRREIESTSELRALFCRRPNNAYNECRAYLENRCQYAETAKQECREIAADQDNLLDLLTTSMNARCETQDTIQTLQFSDLTSSIPFSSVFILNGQEDKLIRAVSNTKNATKPRDFIYEFLLKPFCMKYVEEKQSAQNCNAGVEEINKVVQFLNASKPSLSQEGKEEADTLIQNIAATSGKFSEKCEAKEKGAGGICTMIFNR